MVGRRLFNLGTYARLLEAVTVFKRDGKGIAVSQ